ncbi:unnamed protein product [Paramecium octaurelia]|uniref:Uncharacterized protein n=1 Tax=Paramecium octaurelia TaxID=43137 RepID=A0A8S1Y9H9_PAROT|nr:unnamed protein product [Paramecium octaurelia]
MISSKHIIIEMALQISWIIQREKNLFQQVLLDLLIQRKDQNAIYIEWQNRNLQYF